MHTRRIGSLAVSITGLGCNNFGRRLDAVHTAEVVNAALDAGINFFDTADIYGAGDSERFVGKALGARRKDVIIATKFAKPMADGRGASPAYIRHAVEASLQRLGTDYIDLYQQHEADPGVPIADTLGALDDLVKAGKVREIGCSNFSAAQIGEAESAARADGARFVSVQNEYSLLHREPERDGVLHECGECGLAFLPFFPLASGLLTGKYHRGQPAPEGTRLAGKSSDGAPADTATMDLVERLRAFAEDRHHSLLDLAFAWLLAHQEVASVIAGATKPDQVRSNARAGDWTLSAADLHALETIIGPA